MSAVSVNQGSAVSEKGRVLCQKKVSAVSVNRGSAVSEKGECCVSKSGECCVRKR